MMRDSEGRVPYKMKTSITEEDASKENPYLAVQRRVFGYTLADLRQNTTFLGVVFLLFGNDLPSEAQEALLNSLAITLSNPGPRHPATRSAMIAGVSKTRHEHILPIALLTGGGERGGVQEVELAYDWLQENIASPPDERAGSAPGFGSVYGQRDPIIEHALMDLSSMKGAGPALQWLVESHKMCGSNKGVLDTALCAAVCLDLGFSGRQAGGLFQLFCAPGVLAHGLEQTHNPISAYPVMEDDRYELK